jgi:high-affinity iron transporter
MIVCRGSLPRRAVLPTFVIGLREGLEAALIVGIVAAFLGRQGRRDALRQVWIGVGAAVAICIAIAVVLQVVSSDLPQRGQEGLETVVGLFAVVMVTYMVAWMRRHARDLKGQLEGAAAAALASGSARALVMMAFLAVLREGFETAVFLLATFHASNNAGATLPGRSWASPWRWCSATGSTAAGSRSTCRASSG